MQFEKIHIHVRPDFCTTEKQPVKAAKENPTGYIPPGIA